jgi:hypothetical protein
MSFRNDIVEASAVAIFDLIENRNNYLKRPDFVPYVFAGLAGFYHNPKGLVGDNAPAGLTPGTYVSLADLRTEGQASAYSKAQFSVPFGGGIRYRINRNFDASLEIGWRKTFTDYLDDVGGKYANTFTSPAQAYFGGGNPIASAGVDGQGGTFEDGGGLTRSRQGDFGAFDIPGALRGDKGNKTDWYIVTGVTLNYILTPRIKNPKFR